MDAILNETIEEGQVPKTHEEDVSQVLGSTKFLQSAGLQPVAASKSSKSTYAARVRELEVDVQTEKQGAAALQEKFEVLEKKFVESEAARDKNLEEIEALKKHAEKNRCHSSSFVQCQQQVVGQSSVHVRFLICSFCHLAESNTKNYVGSFC